MESFGLSELPFLFVFFLCINPKYYAVFPISVFFVVVHDELQAVVLTDFASQVISRTSLVGDNTHRS